MHERVGAETQDSPERRRRSAPRQGGVAERMLALQRTAGNAAVTRLLARAPAGPGAIDMTPTEFVFILGAKDDAALKVAKEHYRSVVMSSLTRRVITRDEMDDPSLNGVFAYLSQFKYPMREITLVVHGTGNGTLSVPLNAADDDNQTTPDELEKAINDGVLTPLNDGQITSKTRIRLQACFTGDGPRMVNLLDKAFGEGWGTVIAPTVEVGYAKNIWHDEGLTGWWVTSPEELSVGRARAGAEDQVRRVGEARPEPVPGGHGHPPQGRVHEGRRRDVGRARPAGGGPYRTPRDGAPQAGSTSPTPSPRTTSPSGRTTRCSTPSPPTTTCPRSSSPRSSGPGRGPRSGRGASAASRPARG